MPAKYHIHVHPAPPRIRPVGKLGIVDWKEDCSGCHNCVKRACIYGFFRDEADTLRGAAAGRSQYNVELADTGADMSGRQASAPVHRAEIGFLDYIYQCKGCLSCIQDCTKNILTRVVNPEYARLGDGYFTPEIVLSTWYQAETGHIPVSGAGYGGFFSGSGFDSMWTDMSEIVRPTRDGIHGREYINTSVDLGRKQKHLVFEVGEPNLNSFPLVEIPFPVIFEVIPEPWHVGPAVAAAGEAAARLGLLAVMRSDRIPAGLSVEQENIVPYLETPGAAGRSGFEAAAMVIVPDGPDVAAVQAGCKQSNADQVVAIRVTASPDAASRVVELTAQGAEAIHLVFDRHGRELGPSRPRHARDVLREVHTALVKDGSRDQVTLIASGGIGLAEHVAKAIICGADLVAVDIPLVLALECRLCGECGRGGVCPIALSAVDPEFATQRIVNLMGAWHLQLVEMLGAMGIREVRRLRGETGRCMFFEDLERETFGQLFGTRREDVRIS